MAHYASECVHGAKTANLEVLLRKRMNKASICDLHIHTSAGESGRFLEEAAECLSHSTYVRAGNCASELFHPARIDEQ